MALFDKLLELKWGGLSVPFESLETSGSHDLAEHKRVDRQGARLEATGRNPYDFEVRIPFLNGLARGPQENWDNLFPETFTVFLGFLEDRSTQPLQHPLFGDILCKPVTWKVSLIADVRNGVMMDVHFRETSEGDATPVGGASATLAAASAAAIDLDNSLNQLFLVSSVKWVPPGAASFEDFINQVSSIGDRASLFKNQVFGKIDGAIASLNKLSDSISGTATMITSIPGSFETSTANLGNAAARIVESANQLVFALFQVKSSYQTKDQSIAFYVVQADTTIGALASQLKNNVSDLVQLNPLLCSSPVVPPQSIVRYYTGAGVVFSSPFS